MNRERREYVYTAVFLNCVTLALATVAFALSLWLAASGRIFSEGVDAVFLFAAGIVVACAFASVPLLSIRDGLLAEVRELFEAADRARAGRTPRRAPAWRESAAH